MYANRNRNPNWYPPSPHGNGMEYHKQWEMGYQDHFKEFFVGAGEMAVQFGRGCKDIVTQTIGRDDSFLVKNLGRKSWIGKRIASVCEEICDRLEVVNEYLPEDKDPLHVWTVISLVIVLVFSVLIANTGVFERSPVVKRVFVHPPSASRLLLPDGRYIAYKEAGVSSEAARFTLIAPHSFLSSRLAGVPGVKGSLLEEFGARLLTYDLPGYGESDPHPNRDLKSSATDIMFLANNLGVNKFWILGYSTGSIHAWAALRHIPDRIAGAAMFAPMVNPYDPLMTRDERRGIWEKWSRKKKFMLAIARRFPSLLPYFYRRSFLSGKHGRVYKWLSLSLCSRDKALVDDPIYEAFLERDVEEAIRQGAAKPFVEEASMLVSNWGFSISEMKLQKKAAEGGVLAMVKRWVTGAAEELSGFVGPIHLWQGMDDMVVPPAMTDFVHRLLPGAAVHKLPYEGHFTYFYFCDECHRQMLTTLFGIPQGPLQNTAPDDVQNVEVALQIESDQ